MIDTIRRCGGIGRPVELKTPCLQASRFESEQRYLLLLESKKKMYTTDELRTKIHAAGWVLRELPIRGGGANVGEIRSYKMIAIKGERSLTLGGANLEEAMFSIARTLGVVR